MYVQVCCKGVLMGSVLTKVRQDLELHCGPNGYVLSKVFVVNGYNGSVWWYCFDVQC